MDNLITDAVQKFKPDIALSNGFRFAHVIVDEKTAATRNQRVLMEYVAG
jgi:hypothetical protein